MIKKAVSEFCSTPVFGQPNFIIVIVFGFHFFNIIFIFDMKILITLWNNIALLDVDKKKPKVAAKRKNEIRVKYVTVYSIGNGITILM